LFHKENEFAVKDFPDLKEIYKCDFISMLVGALLKGCRRRLLDSLNELSKVCWLNQCNSRENSREVLRWLNNPPLKNEQ
jgi:hypothetical protein